MAAYTLVLVGIYWGEGGATNLGYLSQIDWACRRALLAGWLLGGFAGVGLVLKNNHRAIKRPYEVMKALGGQSRLR